MRRKLSRREIDRLENLLILLLVCLALFLIHRTGTVSYTHLTLPTKA